MVSEATAEPPGESTWSTTARTCLSAAAARSAAPTESLPTVRPVGVRRLTAGYRREAPMPVFHTPALPAGRPLRRTRCLECVEIRRGQPPQPQWG